jgi:hypothetical protein
MSAGEVEVGGTECQPRTMRRGRGERKPTAPARPMDARRA